MPGRKITKKKKSSAESSALNLKKYDTLISLIPEQIQQHIYEQNVIQDEINKKQFENFRFKRNEQAELHHRLVHDQLQLKNQKIVKIVDEIIDISIYIMHESNSDGHLIERNANFIYLKNKFTQGNLKISSEFSSCGQEVINQILSQIIPRPYESFIWHIDQLMKLSSDMLKIAPSGYCSVKSFTYYLQDILCCTVLDTKNIRAPLRWYQMEPATVADFVFEAANGKESLNWRVFVFNLSGLRVPTLDELLQQQNRFMKTTILPGQKLISRRLFNRCELWFERDFEEEIDKPNMLFWMKFWYRCLIFKMYRVNSSSVNFLTLLLDLATTYHRWDSFIRIISLVNCKKFVHEKHLSIRYETYLNNKYRAFRKFSENLTDSILKNIFIKKTDQLVSQPLQEPNDGGNALSYLNDLICINSTETEMETQYFMKREYSITYDEFKHFLSRTCVEENYENEINLCSRIFHDVVKRQEVKNSFVVQECALVHHLFENVSFQNFLKTCRHGLQTENCLKILYEKLKI